MVDVVAAVVVAVAVAGAVLDLVATRTTPPVERRQTPWWGTNLGV